MLDLCGCKSIASLQRLDAFLGFLAFALLELVDGALFRIFDASTETLGPRRRQRGRGGVTMVLLDSIELAEEICKLSVALFVHF